jgi:hypothetical protein
MSISSRANQQLQLAPIMSYFLELAERILRDGVKRVRRTANRRCFATR